jgi:hypothetical protein
MKVAKFWPKPMGGILVMPGSKGGTNWYPPSYSPRTGLFYISVWDNYQALSTKQPYNWWTAGLLYTGGGWWPGFGEKGPQPAGPPVFRRQVRRRVSAWLQITRRRPKDTARSTTVPVQNADDTELS